MNLTTRYLGLTLNNPLIAGAGPLNSELDNIRRLEDLGAGAVVMPSIFEEQIEHETHLLENLIAVGTNSYAEALTYFPPMASYRIGSYQYVEAVHHAAEAVDIPVIASLNGITDHGWIDYACQIEQAGASALELNIYFIPSDIDITGQKVEQRYVDVLKAVKRAVKIPVAVKISPYFSSIGHMALQLDQAGVNGLVLFNRFYQPDIDLARLALISDLELSKPSEIRLPLLWIGILAGQLKASLAASTGVENVDEVIKYLLAGADVVMTTSALLRHGIEHMRVLTDNLTAWFKARDLESPDAIRGRLSHKNIVDPITFERANYIKILQSYKST